MKIRGLLSLTSPLFAIFFVPALFAPAFADIPAGSSNCPHVRVLTSADSAQVEEAYRHSVITPQEKQREVLKLALDALPPLVCSSVRRVVFLNAYLVSSPDAIAWVGRSRPDLINISAFTSNASEVRLNPELTDVAARPNESPEAYARRMRERKRNMVTVWPEVIHSILHEAFHCAAHLLESVGPSPSGAVDPWPAVAKQRAKTVLENARLRTGFENEWTRINNEFVNIGYAEPYSADRVGKLGEPPNGYMTMYAGKEAGEDMAETASWAVAMPYLDRSYLGFQPNVSNWKIACSKLQNYRDGGVPSALSALFTKLNFLLDLELIREEDLEACVGNGSIGIKGADGNNLSFRKYPSGDVMSTYDTDFKVTRTPSMLAFSGWHQMTINGKTYPALLELQFSVRETALPRGVYRVRQCNIYLPPGHYPFASPVVIRRRVEGNNSQSICAYEAIVLVVRATDKFIQGSAFVQKVWKFSAPPVPEVSGFPVTITFSAKR